MTPDGHDKAVAKPHPSDRAVRLHLKLVAMEVVHVAL